jgi:hypothetical protein
LPPFFEQLLAKNRNHHYTAITMNALSQTEKPDTTRGTALASLARHFTLHVGAIAGAKGTDDFFGPGGRRNSLKSLVSANEIKGKSCVFL